MHMSECALLSINCWRFPFNFSQGYHGRGQWWSQFLAHASSCLAENLHREAGPSSLCPSMNVAECLSLLDASSRVWINGVCFLLLSMSRWSPLWAWCKQDGWHPRINSRYHPLQEMTLELPDNCCLPSQSLWSFICCKTGQRIPDTVSPFRTNSLCLASHDNDRYITIVTTY